MGSLVRSSDCLPTRDRLSHFNKGLLSNRMGSAMESDVSSFQRGDQGLIVVGCISTFSTQDGGRSGCQKNCDFPVSRTVTTSSDDSAIATLKNCSDP